MGVKRVAGMLTLAFLVSGCSSGPTIQWVRPGGTPDDYERDSTACLKWAKEVVPTYGVPGLDQNLKNYSDMRFHDVLVDCMEKRGWIQWQGSKQ